MNFIDEINAFEQWLETNYLSSLSQLLWYKLFMLFNRSGWKEWVTVDNQRLMAKIGVSREATFIKYRDELINSGLFEYIKGKKGSPNKYKMISLNTTLRVVQSEVNRVVNTVANSEVNRVVQTVDIYKQNKTKQNIKDISSDISLTDCRQRYTPKQLEVIDMFFDILKHTRRSAKIADSVVLNIYKDWSKHEAKKVVYALHKYIKNDSLHDKRESYVLGIINKTTMSEIESYKENYQKGGLKPNEVNKSDNYRQSGESKQPDVYEEYYQYAPKL